MKSYEIGGKEMNKKMKKAIALAVTAALTASMTTTAAYAKGSGEDVSGSLMFMLISYD